MMDLPERWTRGLDERGKRELYASLNSSAFTRLVEILRELDIEAAALKEADYQNPSWAYFQAHKNGERSAYR